MAKDLLGKQAPDFDIQLLDGSTRSLWQFVEAFVFSFCLSLNPARFWSLPYVPGGKADRDHVLLQLLPILRAGKQRAAKACRICQVQGRDQEQYQC